jgi:UDP-2,3-diacylglucosamine pyrophosphatase LpxH
MNGDERKVVSVGVSFSDLHIAESSFNENGTHNLITDFHSDRELVNLLRELDFKHQDVPSKKIIWNGDIFDSQNVSLLGSYEDPPIKSVGVYKMRKIIRAYPEIFDCLRALTENGWKMIFVIGNHDVFVSWREVQATIRRRLAGRLPRDLQFERVVFDDEFEADGYLFRHYYEVEPYNAVAPPEKRFIKGYRVKIGRPTSLWFSEEFLGEFKKKKKGEEKLFVPCTILNAPFGNYLTVKWTIPLKQVGDPEKDGPHAWVGRMYTFGPIWRYAIVNPRYWGFAFWAFARWFRGLLGVLFGEALLDVRRKVSKNLPSLLWQLLLLTFVYTRRDTSEMQVALCRERLRQNKAEGKTLRGIVAGHTHKFGVWINDDGSVFNTGTWINMYKLPPKPKGFWNNIKWLFGTTPPLPHIDRTFFIHEEYEDGEFVRGIYKYDPQTRSYEKIR